MESEFPLEPCVDRGQHPSHRKKGKEEAAAQSLLGAQNADQDPSKHTGTDFRPPLSVGTQRPDSLSSLIRATRGHAGDTGEGQTLMFKMQRQEQRATELLGWGKPEGLAA